MQCFLDGIGFLSFQNKWTKWIKRKKQKGEKLHLSLWFPWALSSCLIQQFSVKLIDTKINLSLGVISRTLNSALSLSELGMLHLQTLVTGWCAPGIPGSSDQPGLTLQIDIKASPLPCLQSWKSSWKNAQTLKRSMRIVWLCGTKCGQPGLWWGRAAAPGIALQQRCSIPSSTVHPGHRHLLQEWKYLDSLPWEWAKQRLLSNACESTEGETMEGIHHAFSWL